MMKKIVLASVISSVATVFVIEKLTNRTVTVKFTVTRSGGDAM